MAASMIASRRSAPRFACPVQLRHQPRTVMKSVTMLCSRSRRAGGGVVVHHRRADAVGHVVGGPVHQVAVEQEQVAGLHQHRHRRGHVVVDDLHVAVVRAGAGVGHVLVDRLAVRAGDHVEAPVLEGGRGDGQPDARGSVGAGRTRK